MLEWPSRETHRDVGGGLTLGSQRPQHPGTRDEAEPGQGVSAVPALDSWLQLGDEPSTTALCLRALSSTHSPLAQTSSLQQPREATVSPGGSDIAVCSVTGGYVRALLRKGRLLWDQHHSCSSALPCCGNDSGGCSCCLWETSCPPFHLPTSAQGSFQGAAVQSQGTPSYRMKSWDRRHQGKGLTGLEK